MYRLHLVLLSTLVASIGMASFRKDAHVQAADKAAPSANGRARSAQTAGKPRDESVGQAAVGLSPEALQQFANELHNAAHSEDVKIFSRRIDWSRLLSSALAGIELPKASRQKLVKDYKDQIAATGGAFAHHVIREVAAGGRYDFVGWRRVDAGYQALFRLTGIEGGLDYHYVMVEQQPGGGALAGDFYLMAAGELLSSAMRRALLPLAVKESNAAAERLSATDRALAAHDDTWQAMSSAVDDGKFADVLAQYGKFPPELRKQKHMLLIRLKAAQAGDEKAAVAALAEYQRAFPNDPSADLISIDWHAAQKNFAEAHAAVGRLDKTIAGDAYLGTVRAKLLVEEGKTEEARRLLEKVVADSPQIENAYWGLSELYVSAGDFDKTARMLSAVAKNFGADLSTLPEVPTYAKFVKSEQYRALMQKQKQ